MGGLFVYTLWAGYLGWQWRRVRTIQNEINDLKKQVKPTPEGTLVEIQQLTEVQYCWVLEFETFGGAINTWFRTGKLFPGPHLFAGAGKENKMIELSSVKLFLLDSFE